MICRPFTQPSLTRNLKAGSQLSHETPLFTKNGKRRCKCLEVEGSYFVKEHFESKSKYTEEDVIKMLEFLVDHILSWKCSNSPMGTNYAPLKADIFLYSYEAKLIQSLLSASKKQLSYQFNFTYRYIEDVLLIIIPDFENHLVHMYPTELKIKDTTESSTSASYLDLLLSIGRDGQLRTPFTTSVTISVSI